MVVIRLARGGAKRRPFFNVVVADSREPRDGRFIERVGTWNPILPKGDEKRVILNVERIQHWRSVGAQPTDRVARMLSTKELVAKPAIPNQTLKNQPKKKFQKPMTN